MKEIKLTRNKTAIVDDEDFDFLNQFTWQYATRGCATRTVRYGKREYNKKVCIKMHRLIMGITDLEMKVDHINNNPLDNRKENLRICTQAENSRNQSISRVNTSGYKGVIFDKRPLSKPWVAQIRALGKYRKIGYFITKEEAANAYNEAAITYFGKFAKLNDVKKSS